MLINQRAVFCYLRASSSAFRRETFNILILYTADDFDRLKDGISGIHFKPDGQLARSENIL